MQCSCLYLPRFGGGNKVNAVKSRKEVSEREGVMSRTVSLENFECGSWASAAIFNEIEGESANSYFDLPMELIKCISASEECIQYSPVAAASFVYGKDLKGVLRNGSSRAFQIAPDIQVLTDKSSCKNGLVAFSILHHKNPKSSSISHFVFTYINNITEKLYGAISNYQLISNPI
ncbi:hypothetical protein SESBI_24091 [Sesbania bispinosa]|nr:hypothetical protein SESBI_24091 [Sesbania bispinosa]